MSEKLRLSLSKTKTFIDCKAKFKFTYIEKLPRKEWEHHTLGKFCHSVLEEFHRAYLENNSVAPYNIEMGKAYKKALLEYKANMTADMRKECKEIIDKYLRLISNDKENNSVANVIAVEKKFDFELADNLILNGAIDRIQVDDDNVLHIADYKTTKNKKYLANDWFQLMTYGFVMLNEDPSITKIRGSYILLRHDFEYITKEFSVDEILAVKQKYIDYAAQINRETEYKPNPTALCRFCDFLPSCPDGKSKAYDDPNVFGEVKW